MTRIRSSRFFLYFDRIEHGIYRCRICKEYGIETIVQRRAYHIMYGHPSLYTKEKKGLSATSLE